MYVAKRTHVGELWTTVMEREWDVGIHYHATDVAATAYVLLVDKSDNINFPHKNLGQLDLTQASFYVDKATNTIGAIKIGVITRIDGTNADVSWVTTLPFVKGADTSLRRDRRFTPSHLKCVVENNALKYFATNEKSTNVSAINTATLLNTPVGTAYPAEGDVVVAFEYTSGTSYNANVSCFYHTHPED